MIRKYLLIILFVTMIVPISAETVAISVSSNVEQRLEKGLEQAKALAKACQNAGLSQEETLKLVAEQFEKKVLAEDEQLVSLKTKKVLFVLLVTAILAGGVYLIYKNWPSKKEDESNVSPCQRKIETCEGLSREFMHLADEIGQDEAYFERLEERARNDIKSSNFVGDQFAMELMEKKLELLKNDFPPKSNVEKK